MGAVAGSLTPTPGFADELLRQGYSAEVAEWIWTEKRVLGRPQSEVYAEADEARATGRLPEPKADAPKRRGRPPKVKVEPGERPPLKPEEVEVVG